MLKLRSLISFPADFELLNGLALCAKSFDFKGYSEESARQFYELNFGASADKVAGHRLKEFFLGREVIKEALEAVGCVVPEQIPVSPAGYPIIPEKFLVGLSHTRIANLPVAVAIAAKTSEYLAIGIDIESKDRVASSNTLGLTQRITTEAEKEWLNRLSDSEEKAKKTLQVFSAKEAIYKALWPRHGAPSRFADVSILPSIDEATFTLEFNVAVSNVVAVGDRTTVYLLDGPDILGTLIAIPLTGNGSLRDP